MLAPSVAEQRRHAGQRAGHVAHVDRQPHEAPRTRHAALDDLGQQQRLDVAAAQHQPDAAPGEALAVLHQRRQADRAGALDHRLLDLEQREDRHLDVALVDQQHVVDRAPDDRQRQRAGLLHADAVGDRRAAGRSRAAVQRVPDRREALALHADDADVGPHARAPRRRCRRSARRRRPPPPACRWPAAGRASPGRRCPGRRPRRGRRRDGPASSPRSTARRRP